MAYEVTATRRRPQKFENLVGQEFVAETLKNSIQSKKIAHAYLFTGPRGCGKTSTARIFAKALNCKNGPTSQPCGECEACREITAGSSLDVIEIDGASNNGVDSVRQIKDEVLFPPNSSRYKIYIIDEVHMLSTGAFNALLKTIEEPPPYVIFIFATTELQKVPATIKSRCQQFNFRLVPVEKVKEQLALAAKEAGIQADDEALYWIARESGGSMRDSYTLFDQVAAFSDGQITYEKIRDKLGLVGVDRLNELFTLCVKGDVNQALAKLDEYLQNGVSIEQLISNCTDYLRSLLLIKSGVTKEALLGQSSERFSKEVLETWSSVQVERAMSLFLQLYRDIRYSLNSRYEFELALSRLCWLKDYVSSVEVKKAVDAVKPILEANAGCQTPLGQNGIGQNGAGQNNFSGGFSHAGERQAPVFDILNGKIPGKSPSSSFSRGGAEPPDNNSATFTSDSYKSEGHVSFYPGQTCAKLDENRDALYSSASSAEGGLYSYERGFSGVGKGDPALEDGSGQGTGPATSGASLTGQGAGPGMNGASLTGQVTGPATSGASLTGQGAGPGMNGASLTGQTAGPATSSPSLPGQNTGPAIKAAPLQRQIDPGLQVAKIAGFSSGPQGGQAKIVSNNEAPGVQVESLTKPEPKQESLSQAGPAFDQGAVTSSFEQPGAPDGEDWGPAFYEDQGAPYSEDEYSQPVEENFPPFEGRANAFNEGPAPFNAQKNFPDSQTSAVSEQNSSPGTFFKTSVSPTFQNPGDLEGLKKNLIADFSSSDPMVASVLMQSASWTFLNDKLCICLESAFDKMQLQNKASLINKKLFQFFGKEIKLEFDVQKKENAVKMNLPEKVKILCDEFRGSVV